MSKTLTTVLIICIFITSINFFEQIYADTSHTKTDITYSKETDPINCLIECEHKVPRLYGKATTLPSKSFNFLNSKKIWNQLVLFAHMGQKTREFYRYF